MESALLVAAFVTVRFFFFFVHRARAAARAHYRRHHRQQSYTKTTVAARPLSSLRCQQQPYARPARAAGRDNKLATRLRRHSTQRGGQQPGSRGGDAVWRWWGRRAAAAMQHEHPRKRKKSRPQKPNNDEGQEGAVMKTRR